MARPLYIFLGVFFVGLAFVGVFLPVLPTTPFLLVATWAFSKGSPRLERWLLQHPKLGPAVRDWRAHRIIPLKAKLLASIMMMASLVYLIWFTDVALRYALMAGGTMLVGAAYIWSKPHAQPIDAHPSANDALESTEKNNAEAPPSAHAAPIDDVPFTATTTDTRSRA